MAAQCLCWGLGNLASSRDWLQNNEVWRRDRSETMTTSHSSVYKTNRQRRKSVSLYPFFQHEWDRQMCDYFTVKNSYILHLYWVPSKSLTRNVNQCIVGSRLKLLQVIQRFQWELIAIGATRYTTACVKIDTENKGSKYNPAKNKIIPLPQRHSQT